MYHNGCASKFRDPYRPLVSIQTIDVLLGGVGPICTLLGVATGDDWQVCILCNVDIANPNTNSPVSDNLIVEDVDISNPILVGRHNSRLIVLAVDGHLSRAG